MGRLLRRVLDPAVRVWRRLRARWAEPAAERRRTREEIAEGRAERERIERQIRALDAEVRSRGAR